MEYKSRMEVKWEVKTSGKT